MILDAAIRCAIAPPHPLPLHRGRNTLSVARGLRQPQQNLFKQMDVSAMPDAILSTPDKGFSHSYGDALPTWANAYIWPALKTILDKQVIRDRRAFDLGCGNGATANMLYELGFDVTGVDISETGIASGRRSFPCLKLHVGNVYDHLAEAYGQYPLVVSPEVIEHCYDPRGFCKTFYDLISPGGIGILSTPYHGYWKNLAISLLGKWDDHLTVLC